MISFKEMVAEDVDILINSDELANTHMIEGNQVYAVFQTEIEQKGDGIDEYRVSNHSVTIYIKSGFMKRRPQGSNLNVDGGEYIVDDWQSNNGLDIIKCHKNIVG